MLFKLYIGQNNKTKKLEDKKAIKIISKRFKGFTTYKCLGYWEGIAERSLIVEIEARKQAEVMSLAQDLAKKLKQDAVGLAVIGKLNFISV